jgi:hypothetical protein
MYKLKVILIMLGRGAAYGAVLGTLSGCAFGLPFFLFGGFLGFFIGLCIGLGLGIILGFIAGLITVQFFYPPKDTKRYQVVIMLICGTVSAVIVPLAVDWFWFGYFTLRFSGASILFAFIAIIAGLAFSKWLTAWYIREGQAGRLPLR